MQGRFTEQSKMHQLLTLDCQTDLMSLPDLSTRVRMLESVSNSVRSFLLLR